MLKDCKVTLPDHEINEFSEDLQKKVDIEENKKPKGSIGQFRETLCEVLHHHYFQIIICVLVLLDTAVVITEIMVESSKQKSKSENLEAAEYVLHYVSLSILSIFMFEIIIKIFAMGTDLLRHKLEIFDAIVVIVSFFLDIFLSSGGLKDGVEFLVLLRLWRITRIINGIVISVKSRADEKVNTAHQKVQIVEQTNHELEHEIDALKSEIDHLKSLLKVAGYDYDSQQSTTIGGLE